MNKVINFCNNNEGFVVAATLVVAEAIALGVYSYYEHKALETERAAIISEQWEKFLNRSTETSQEAEDK